MGEEVERLRGQVGALRREVWFTRRRDIGGMELSPNNSAGMTGGQQHPAELVPTRRLSGLFPTILKVNGLDSTTKQIVKL